MSDNVRPLRLYLALFDRAHHSPTEMHWTWFHGALASQLRKRFYAHVIAPELAKAPLKSATSLLSGGFASVDPEWCCWFRLFDAGRDTHGRPGRYLMLAAFARRDEARSVDALQVLQSQPFKAIAAVAKSQAPPPLAEPARLELQLNLPRHPLDKATLGRLRGAQGPLALSGDTLSAASVACSCAATEEAWQLIVRNSGSALSADVTFRSRVPARSVEPPAAPQVKAPPATPVPPIKTAPPPAVSQPAASPLGPVLLAGGLGVFLLVSIVGIATLFWNLRGKETQVATPDPPKPDATNPPDPPTDPPAQTGEPSPDPAPDRAALVQKLTAANPGTEEEWTNLFGELANSELPDLSKLGGRSLAWDRRLSGAEAGGRKLAQPTPGERSAEKLAQFWQRCADDPRNADIQAVLLAGSDFWNNKAATLKEARLRKALEVSDAHGASSPNLATQLRDHLVQSGRLGDAEKLEKKYHLPPASASSPMPEAPPPQPPTPPHRGKIPPR